MSVHYAQCGEVELAYETFGSPYDPTIVLIMGLGTQMIGWPDEFCRGLADRGFRVVRFDNRDAGLSTHLRAAGTPPLLQSLLALPLARTPYVLADMADDTVGLVDALGVERVHVVGASMGGMIAQEVAIRHTARVTSLTSIMSTTGPSVGRPRHRAAAAVFKIIGSPGYPADEPPVAARGREAFRRATDPAGVRSIPGELIRAFETKFAGTVILEGYGLSETASTVTSNISADERKVLSIGKPLWGVDVRILDRQGNELGFGPDQVGEIVVKPGTDTPVEEIDAHCKARLAAYKYPRVITVMPDLPKGPTGKILKRELVG